MTYRRKVPKRRSPTTAPSLDQQLADHAVIVNELQQSIAELDNLVANAELSMSDCLADLSTPGSSEDDEPLGARRRLTGENHRAATEQLNAFLRPNLTPGPNTPIAPLYSDPKYLHKVYRKVQKMRRFTRKCDFMKAFSHSSFWGRYTDTRDLYLETDNREDLMGLVALFNWIRDGCAEDDYVTTESESDISDFSSSEDDDHDQPPTPPNAQVPIVV
jgi:hypothetical protein